MLVRMLPIWITNIMFWVVYAQVTTLFLNQGTTLNRHVGRDFEIPAASMLLFLHLSICLFLPVYDKLLVPLARRFTGEPCGFTILQRIAIGQGLSVLPIAIAALVEVRRLRLVHSEEGGVLPMSIFWLVPQYALMGITEVFLSIGQIEFFSDQAPESMRSLGSAMAFCAISLGSFGSSMLLGVVRKVTDGGWIGNDLNESRVDYFYWLLTVLTVVNLPVYLFFARRHRNYNDLDVKEKLGGSGDMATIASVVDKRVHPVSVDADL